MKAFNEIQDEMQINTKNRHELMYEYYKFMKKKKEASDQIIIQKVNLSGFFFGLTNIIEGT